jgi:multidrug efflux pump subunit AcrA (membrane-fusion protein)
MTLTTRSKPWPSLSPSLLAAAAAALGSALLSGCSGPAHAAPAPEEPLVHVRTVAVAAGPVERPVRAAGLVATKDQWDLAFKVGGVLARVEVHEGQRVAKGQVLAGLDPTELAAGVRQAREGLGKARRDAARLAHLVASETAPRIAAEDTRTAEAVAEAQLAAAEFNLRHATLVAPDDGWIDHRLAEPGEVVAPGRPIVHLSGRGRGFVVRAALADRDVLGLAPETRAAVTLDAAPGRAISGRVTEVARAAGSPSSPSAAGSSRWSSSWPWWPWGSRRWSPSPRPRTRPSPTRASPWWRCCQAPAPPTSSGWWSTPSRPS